MSKCMKCCEAKYSNVAPGSIVEIRTWDGHWVMCEVVSVDWHAESPVAVRFADGSAIRLRGIDMVRFPITSDFDAECEWEDRWREQRAAAAGGGR